jgi:hypothetical protein
MLSPLALPILLDPSERHKHLITFRKERQTLYALGLFEKPEGTGFTPAGKLAHWLAREMSPRRAHYRTPAWFAQGYGRFFLTCYPSLHGEDAAIALCEDLQARGVAEPDPDYRDGQTAWRLRFADFI